MSDHLADEIERMNTRWMLLVAERLWLCSQADSQVALRRRVTTHKTETFHHTAHNTTTQATENALNSTAAPSPTDTPPPVIFDSFGQTFLSQITNKPPHKQHNTGDTTLSTQTTHSPTTPETVNTPNTTTQATGNTKLDFKTAAANTLNITIPTTEYKLNITPGISQHQQQKNSTPQNHQQTTHSTPIVQHK